MDQVDAVWDDLAADEMDNSDSDSNRSEVSSGGYEAEMDTSDDDDRRPMASPPRSPGADYDEGEFWDKVCEDLSVIAEEQAECNRPEE